MDDLITEKILNQLNQCILEGNEIGAVETSKKLVDNNIDLQYAIDTICNKCMKLLGRLYEEREIFIPELLLSAHAANSAINFLREHHKQYVSQRHSKIVVGVVSGDFHDIGKNIVKMMLELSGYDVHDIGTNNSAEDFLRKAEEVDANIVGVSALMTTSMDNMIDVVNIFLEKRNKTNVIIGGAPVTQEFADEIGAHGYAEDASKAVDLVEHMENKEDRYYSKRKVKYSSYERVMKTLEHDTPDMVPTAPPFQGYWALNEAHVSVPTSINHPILAAKKQFKISNKCGFDMFEACWDWLAAVDVIGGHVRVERKGNPVTMEPLVKDQGDIDSLWDYDLMSNKRLRASILTAKKMMELNKGENFLYATLAMPFTLAAEIRGTQNLLMDIFCNRPLVFELLDFCTDFKIECSKIMIEEGIDSIMYCDPVASGDLISPEVYEEFALPSSKELMRKHDKEMVCSGIHICGNILDRIELLNELSTDIVSIDSHVNLSDARKILNDDIILMGNVCTMEILYASHSNVVRQQARSNIKQMGLENYILASGCDIAVDTPIQNVRTLTSTPKEFLK